MGVGRDEEYRLLQGPKDQSDQSTAKRVDTKHLVNCANGLA
jgi:hypothetical protein